MKQVYFDNYSSKISQMDGQCERFPQEQIWIYKERKQRTTGYWNVRMAANKESKLIVNGNRNTENICLDLTFYSNEHLPYPPLTLSPAISHLVMLLCTFLLFLGCCGSYRPISLSSSEWDKFHPTTLCLEVTSLESHLLKALFCPLLNKWANSLHTWHTKHSLQVLCWHPKKKYQI